MPWWIWTLLYVAGGMVTFRVQYLSFLDGAEREIDACQKSSHRNYSYSKHCDYEAPHKADTVSIPVAIAVFWPVFLICVGMWKSMFPRGVITKYSRQRELERKQKAKQKELDKLADDIKKASKAAGLKIPEGL